MTRLIAGTHGGRRLQVPPGTTTRPTSDRAREGLFSSLQSLVDLDGATVLDLYAGSGALGLEAVSRGAASAVLVDDDPAAVRAMQTNVTDLGLRATVVDVDVARFLTGTPVRFDVVLADPPYDEDVDPVLAGLAPWVADGGVLVLERRTRGPAPAVPEGFELARSRRYGEATLWYFPRS